MLDLLPDLCDEFPDQVNVLQPLFSHFGSKPIFYGKVVTIKCFEDNSLVKSTLATPGKGKVLVVDGGGSNRRALLGDMIAKDAVKNGWEGVVIFGFIRDVGEINTLDIGVKALGACPIKTDKRGLGDKDLLVEFAGTTISPGQMLYADLNGVVISDSALI